MPQLQNKRRSTRSKSLGRQPSRELQTTDQYSDLLTNKTEASGSEPDLSHDDQLLDKQSPGKRESDHVPKTLDNSVSGSLNDNIDGKDDSGNTIEASQTSKNADSGQPTLRQVSDNRGNTDIAPHDTPPTGQELPLSFEGDPWHATFQELRAMRLEMAKIVHLEKSVESHTKQISEIDQQTTVLETAKDQSTATIKELKKEVASLRELVHNQSSTITNLNKFKEDLIQSNPKLKEELTKSSEDTVQEMNELIQSQRDQVDSFNETAGNIKHDMKRELQTEIKKVRDDMDYNSLQSKATN